MRLPFPPKVRSFPSSLLLRSRHDSSTDDAAGADQKGAQRVTGFFATGRISGGIFQTGSNRRRDHRATGSPERYVDRHRFVTSLIVCVRLRHLTLDFLSSGSFRPLLLFFPDDGERFPRRRVSRARPEDGTRGFEAPTRRKDRRRGERRGARFFVVARASSPRERAFTRVIGSDSEYAKRPREVPISSYRCSNTSCD